MQTKKFSIATVATNSIKAWDKNPRVRSKEGIEAIAKSIKSHGFSQPIVVNQDGVICIGHGRWEAAKLLKLKTVPVLKKKMTMAQFKALALADNKTREYSEWDLDSLGKTLNEIKLEMPEVLEATGFSSLDLEMFFTPEQGDEESIDQMWSDKNNRDKERGKSVSGAVGAPLDDAGDGKTLEDEADTESTGNVSDASSGASTGPDHGSDIKIVQLFYKQEELVKFNDKVEALLEKRTTQNLSELVFELVMKAK